MCCGMHVFRWAVLVDWLITLCMLVSFFEEEGTNASKKDKSQGRTQAHWHNGQYQWRERILRGITQPHQQRPETKWSSQRRRQRGSKRESTSTFSFKFILQFVHCNCITIVIVYLFTPRKEKEKEKRQSGANSPLLGDFFSQPWSKRASCGLPC